MLGKIPTVVLSRSKYLEAAATPNFWKLIEVTREKHKSQVKMLSLNAFLKGPPRHNFTRVVTSRLEQDLMLKGQLDTGARIDLGADNRKYSFKEKFLK